MKDKKSWRENLIGCYKESLSRTDYDRSLVHFESPIFQLKMFKKNNNLLYTFYSFG